MLLQHIHIDELVGKKIIFAENNLDGLFLVVENKLGQKSFAIFEILEENLVMASYYVLEDLIEQFSFPGEDNVLIKLGIISQEEADEFLCTDDERELKKAKAEIIALKQEINKLKNNSKASKTSTTKKAKK